MALLECSKRSTIRLTKPDWVARREASRGDVRSIYAGLRGQQREAD